MLRYIFECVKYLGVWSGVILVWTRYPHSGDSFWYFPTSGISWGFVSCVSALIVHIFNLYFSCFLVQLLKFYFVDCFCSPIGSYQGAPSRLVHSEVLHGRMDVFWYEFLIWFSSWFNYWSFSGYAPSIGILVGTAREVDFPNIFASYINAFVFTFTSLSIGLLVSGFCSAPIK